MRVHGYAGGTDNALALAKEYVDSLRQWGGLAETDQDTLKWYLTQTPRRLPPGRPLMAPEEILLVRWPHVEQEWGRDVLRGTKELPGLLETLTIWTQGPMNMNTAVTPTTIWGKTGMRICSPRTTSRPSPAAASTCGAAGTGSTSPYSRVRGKIRSLRWDGSRTNMSHGNTGPYVNAARL